MAITPLKFRRSLDRPVPGHGLTVVSPSRPAPLEAPSEVIWTDGHAGSVQLLPATFDRELNQRIGGAQQAIDFLDRLAMQLEELRRHLRQRLTQTPRGDIATGVPDSSALDRQIQRVNEIWLDRRASSGGTLDSQLGYSASGETYQNFCLEGLDLVSLRAQGSAETLYFSVGGTGQRAASAVTFEAGLSDVAIACRFDRALAPSGIRATLGEGAALSFSVLEAAWPTVRDTLAVMGEGRRFSTGRFNLVRVVAELPVLRPEEWQTDDAGLRQTRQEVFKAQGVVRQARLIVARGLADAGAHLGSCDAQDGKSGGAEAAWCAEFIRAFEAAASRPDYLALSSILPVVTGITRQCVLTVLAPSS